MPYGFKAKAANVIIHSHCHVKALMDTGFMLNLAQRIAAAKCHAFGYWMCCGMAGAFGALESKYELSLKVAETAGSESPQPALWNRHCRVRDEFAVTKLRPPWRRTFTTTWPKSCRSNQVSFLKELFRGLASWPRRVRPGNSYFNWAAQSAISFT
jgi:hypothetical protein